MYGRGSKFYPWSIALVIASSACSKRETEEPAAEQKPVSSAPAVSTSATAAAPQATLAPAAVQSAIEQAIDDKASAGPEVTLLDAGRAPKKVLRYEFSEGRKRKLELGMDQTIRMNGVPEAGGQKMELTIRVAGSVLEKKVGPDGTAQRKSVFESFDIEPKAGPPELKKQMQAGMAQVVGLTIDETISSRGLIQKANVSGAGLKGPQLRQLSDSLQSSAGQMIAPLPAEAVGVGAKWKTVQTIEMAGIALEQVCHFTLVKNEGNTIDTEFTIDQTTRAGDSTKKGEARVTKLQGKGSGKQHVDLKSLVMNGSLDNAVSTAVEPRPGASPIETSITAKLKFSLEE
jgi:hypothetical protein